VIPLPRMGEYTLGIERINIELSCATSWPWSTGWKPSSAGHLPLGKTDDATVRFPVPSCWSDRVQQALALLREVRAQWQHAGG
jgi:hypothetical protein